MDESQEPQDESVQGEGPPPEEASPEDKEPSDPSAEDLTVNANATDEADESSSESSEPEGKALDEAMTAESEQASESDADVSAVEMPDGPEQAPRAEFGPLTGKAAITDKQAGNISLLLDVKLPVSIELGRTKMSISEVLELGSGSIIELDKLAGEPVDILVNNKPLAKGEVVVLDENFGVRITSLISHRERLERLGNQ